jgi:hypothetical protein
MNAIAGSFAVEASDLGSAIRRAGGAFQATGGNLRELEALFTSVRATTRESADSIATGFRTIFTRLQRPRTIQFLKQMNIELSKSGQFIGGYEAIRELSNALQGLSSQDFRFAQIIEELGGFRQVSKVIPLIKEFETAEKALAVAEAGRVSIDKDAEKAQKTIQVQLEKTREAWVKLFREIASSRIFHDMATGALKLANSLAKVLEHLKPLIGPLAIFGGIKAIPALVQFGAGFFGGLHQLGPRGSGIGVAQTITGQTGGKQAETSIKKLVASIDKLDKTVYKTGRAVWATRQLIAQKLIPLMTRQTAMIGAAIPGKKGGSVAGFGRRPHYGGPIYHSGGQVRKSADDVPIMAQKGEYIIRKNMVQKYGKRTFDKFNLGLVEGRHFGGNVVPGGSLRQTYSSMAGSGMGGSGIGSATGRLNKSMNLVSTNMLFLSLMIGSMISATQNQENIITKSVDGFNKLITTLFVLQVAMQAFGGVGDKISAFIKGGGFSSLATGRRGVGFQQMIKSVTPGARGGMMVLAPNAPGSHHFVPTPGVGKPLTSSRRLAKFRSGFKGAFGITPGLAGGLVGGAGLYGAGAIAESGFFGGGPVAEAARKARTTADLRKAEGRRKVAGGLKGAGIGLAIGTAVAGPIGAAIGLAAGGLIGAIAANTKELRQANRSDRFEKASESFADSVDDFKEGFGSQAGIGADLRSMLDQIDASLADRDPEQAESFRDQLRSQIPALIDFKNAVLSSVQVLEDGETFEDAVGSFGDEIVRAYAEATNKSFGEINRRFTRELVSAVNARQNARAQAQARRELYSTSNALRFFADEIHESSLSIKKIGEDTDRISGAASGRYGVPSFTGRKFFGQFGRAAEGRVRDVPEFGKAVQQLLRPIGGEIGQEVGEELTQAAQLIKDLPALLTQVAGDYRLGGELGTPETEELLRQLLNEQGKYGEANINAVVTKLASLVSGGNRQQGEGEFLKLIRENNVAAAQQIIPDALRDMFASMDEMAASVLATSGELEKVFRYRLQIESQMVSQLLTISKTRLEAERALFAARAKSVGADPTLPIERSLATLGQRFSIITKGLVPKGKSDNPKFIGRELAETRRLIEEENKRFQEADVNSNRALQAQERLAELGSKAERLQQALTLLANSTEEVSVLQTRLAKIQEDRERKEGLISKYTFGTFEDRIGVLGAVGATAKAAQTGSLRGVPESLRGDVLQLLNEFANQKLPLFRSAQGEARTGAQLRKQINFNDFIAPLSRRLGIAPGAVGNELLGPSGEEQAIITQMETFFTRQIKAQDALYDHMGRLHTELIEQQKNIHQELADKLKDALLDALQTEKEAEKVGLEERKSRIEEAQVTGNAIVKYFNDQVKDLGLGGKATVRDPQAAIERLQTIFKERDKFEELKTLRSVQGLFSTGTGPFDQFEELMARAYDDLKNIQGTPDRRDARTVIASALEDSDVGRYIVGETKNKFIDLLEGATFFTEGVGTGGRAGFAKTEFDPTLLKDADKMFAILKESGVLEEARQETIKQRQEIEKELLRTIYGHTVNLESGRLALIDFSSQIFTAGSEFDNFSKAIETITSEGGSFRALSKQLDQVNDKLIGLGKTLDSINEARAAKNVDEANAARAAEVVEKKARGGGISGFGTDTVPAMLTPGEFVVRKAATQKYLPLLQQMNAMKLQGGGVVGGATVLTPQMLAEFAHERYKFYNRAGRRSGTSRALQRNGIDEYSRILRDTGDPVETYQRVFKVVWDAVEAVNKAFQDNRYHPFGGERRTNAIERQFGVDARQLSGMRPARGRFFKPARTNLEKAYNAIIANPIRYRSEINDDTKKGIGQDFTPQELAAINAEIPNRRLVHALMPPRYWDQWMRLREATKGQVQQIYKPEGFVSPGELRRVVPGDPGIPGALGTTGAAPLPTVLDTELMPTGGSIESIISDEDRRAANRARVARIMGARRREGTSKGAFGFGARGSAKYNKFIEERRKQLGTKISTGATERSYDLVLPEYIRNKPPGVRERLAAEYYSRRGPDTIGGRPMSLEEKLAEGARQRGEIDRLFGYDREKDLSDLAKQQEAYRKRYHGAPRATPTEPPEVLRAGLLDMNRIRNERKATVDEHARYVLLLKYERINQLRPEEKAELEALRKKFQGRKASMTVPTRSRFELPKTVNLDDPDVYTIKPTGKSQQPIARPISKPPVSTSRTVIEAKGRDRPYSVSEVQSIYGGDKKKALEEFAATLGIPIPTGLKFEEESEQAVRDRYARQGVPFDPSKSRPSGGYYKLDKDTLGFNKFAALETIFHEFGHALDDSYYENALEDPTKSGSNGSYLASTTGGTITKKFVDANKEALQKEMMKITRPDQYKRYGQNDELFAIMMSGVTPELVALRKQFLDIKYPGRKPTVAGYQTGGYVKGPGGVDKIPAMLSSGEYVLNRNAVQALKKGGLVQGYAEGGEVGGVDSIRELAKVIETMSSTANTFSAASQTMNEAATSLSGFTIPDTVMLDSTEFNASAENLALAFGSLERAVANIPQTIQVELESTNQNEDGGLRGEQPTMDFSMFGESVNRFGAFISGFGGSVSEFGSHINLMQQAVSSFENAASALGQGIQLDARYTLDVNIAGAEAFQQMKVDLEGDIKQMVSQQLKSLVDRTGDLGTDLHNLG